MPVRLAQGCEEGFESGAVMYINKPFTANKLLTIVNTMLEQAEAGATPQS